MAKKPTKATAGRTGVDERYAKFVTEYLVSNNATQSAIKAGYSRKTAHVQGFKLLKVPRIAAAIEEGRRQVHQEAAKKLEVTSERVIQELARIGFSDVRRAIKWRAVDHKKTVGRKTTTERRTEFELVDSADLDDDTAAAISGVRMTAHGPRLDFYDKRAALVDLGKVTGVFADGVDVTIPVKFTIEKAGK